MIYLDNAATTRPHPQVVAAMEDMLREVFGNPSSPHRLGIEAERRVRAAREAVARGLGVSPGEVVFTSGATEANNLAVLGAARALARRGRHIVASAVEHPSVLAPCRALEAEGFRLTLVPVDEQGFVDPEAVAQALTEETVLVCIMHVNNEVGTIQPVAEVAQVVGNHRGRGFRPVLHVDAVQALGKVPVEPARWGVDLLSLSGHKIGGPKGVGALYVREGTRLVPLLHGGGQEGGLRSGTENVPGIVGLGRAVELAVAGQESAANRLAALRRRLIDRIETTVPGARLNGPREEGAAPHIVNVSVPRTKGEVLLRCLEQAGVYASTGSACSSRKGAESHVLRALGLSPERIEGSLRFSLSPDTTEEEIDSAAASLATAVREVQGLYR